jgi:TolA-binding protein
MKKLILAMLMALGLTIALASSASSQTQPSTTASNNQTDTKVVSIENQTDTKPVPADQTISFLLDQNDKAKNLITAQEKRIQDLEAEISAEKENGESIGKSYTAAQSEIESLKAANAALHKAVSLNEQTISLLQNDRDKWKDTAKKEKKAKWKAYIGLAGMIALKFLLP